MDNRAIAQHLFGLARSLEQQHANLYRIKAYRQAAQAILSLERPVEEIVAHEGRRALKDLPGIGAKLSVKIETLVLTGDIASLKAEEEKTLVALSA